MFFVESSPLQKTIWDTICDIKHDDIYRTWMSDSKDEVIQCLAEHQNEKIYTSNIVDIVIFALATVANITIVAYYLDDLTVTNHVFKPTQKYSIANILKCVSSMAITI